MKKVSLSLGIIIIFTFFANGQNVGIGTTTPTNALQVVSSTDTALYATTTLNAPLTPAIYGYSNSTNNNQIGILGAYNGSGYGSALAGVGYGGVMPPATKDIGVYASQRSVSGRALYIDGNMQLIDGTQKKGYVLTSDSTGTASWQKTAAGQHAFLATYNSTYFPVATATSTTIPFNTEDYDFGNDFSNGFFTAPDTGLYHFDATVIWALSSSTTDYSLSAYLEISDPAYIFGKVAGVNFLDIDKDAFSGGDQTQTISTDVFLNAGAKVKIDVVQYSSGVQNIRCLAGVFTYSTSRFSGHKLY